ncbi:hypothetical protein ACGFJ7_12330 [Actinoplanes sp. NPDC048988]|uniref:hypothetical protein n=1 Tax=Actinoplanes sp. NPDC048988 TaxID=3363901 RepID=UPI0037243D26
MDTKPWSVRPSFAPRQMLTAKQLNAGLEDEMRRQQLLNRAIHGYGVVAGYGPSVNDRGQLDLTDGLALDRHGRMLYWEGGCVRIDDLVGPPPDREGDYTLVAHFACRPPLHDGCRIFPGDRAQWSLEGVVFSLRHGCHDVDRGCPEHPIGSCVGHDEYMCRRTGSIPGDDEHTVPISEDVEWLSARPGELCPTDEGHWTYDPDPLVAVPLARVRVCDLANREAGDHDHTVAPKQECEPEYGFCRTEPSACPVRPLVYRNPLLYELAKCCDVAAPRIASLSWQPWIDKGWAEAVPWSEFEPHIRRGFEIRFTRPVLVATLHEASVYLEAVRRNRDADYSIARRVPTALRRGRDKWTGIQPIDSDGKLAWGVRLVPTPNWQEAELQGDDSNLFGGAHFELTIRGQLVRDQCDHTLDAQPVGGPGRCQARPGGDFVSVFQVGPRPDDYSFHAEESR